MSTALNNYLAGTSYKTGYPNLRDYQHANRLYVNNNYAYSPKFGFLYYVVFNINQDAIVDDDIWKSTQYKDVGLLVKKIDLPKFQIGNETLNQYNRKTVVQTKLTYSPVSIDFHDDNVDIINKLWINYYKNYFADSNYGTSGEVPKEFKDTKFSETNFQYGIYNNNTKVQFFRSVEIYCLHQQEFTQITLINPKITEWAHDTLQNDGSKVMQNKMSLAYENVLYNYGAIAANESAKGFTSVYYDNVKSPLQVGGRPDNTGDRNSNTDNTLFDTPGAQRLSSSVNRSFGPSAVGRQPLSSSINRSFDPYAGGNGNKRRFSQLLSKYSEFDLSSGPRQYSQVVTTRSIFDNKQGPRAYGRVGGNNQNPNAVGPRAYGRVGGNNQNPNAVLDIVSILAKNYVNANGLVRVTAGAYNIANGALGAISRKAPGKYYEPPNTEYNPGIFNLPGGVGINIFKAFNTGVDGKIRANPAAILFPPKS